MMKRVYLDNNGTTGVDPRVLEAMQAELSDVPANPSSIHSFGQEARRKLARAREEIAAYFGVKPIEIVFTSGGTESMNMLIRGMGPSGHVITSDVEHSCISKTLHSFPDVTALSAGSWGAITPEAVEAAIRPSTRFIILGAVNNETGVKTDIEAIGALAQAHNIPLLVDGVALLGKELFTLPRGVSAIGFSGHKCHAPKGTGIAIVRQGLKLHPLNTGGDQEFGKRAGTENLPGIVALAKAISLLTEELPEATRRMERLRNQLEAALPHATINGEGPRICNTSNLSFPGAEGEVLLTTLDLAGIAASHGSACASGALEPSRILTNMGLPKARVLSSIRFSLSRWTTDDEIARTITVLTKDEV
jgi:cysteine desulfurase